MARDTLSELVFGEKGAKGIDHLVQSFDFSKMNVNDNTRNDYLYTSLAPSWGKLTAESIKNLDKELKVMIGVTMDALAAIPPVERTWEKLVSTMIQIPVLEPDGTNLISRSERLDKSGTNVFKFDGSPNAPIVREVENWFKALISDADVLSSTRIDINVLANVVAQTGAIADGLDLFTIKEESYRKDLLDISVLRFPDISNPYFKLCRIKLSAWRHSKRFFFVQEDRSGISGEYKAQNFRPRRAEIERLSAPALKKAIEEAESVFD